MAISPRMILFVLGLILLTDVRPTLGHGRLIEPPSRASAWRQGFPTPHNYNDHELYCGGFSRQWNKNNGNCGICGDAWDQKTPRPHEFGGRFGQGVTVRKYLLNSVITIRVELTANHNGYFEFRLCPHMENTTQECLDQNLLEQYAPESKEVVTKFYPKDGNKIYEMQYKLPKDLICEHCVIQWRYIAGNNWGMCSDGNGAVGCGHQEEFRACADVAIGLTAEPVIPGTTIRPRPTYVPTRKTTTSKTVTESSNATATSTESTPQEEGSSWIGILIAAIMLFIVLISFALFYFYYYQGGHRIKNLLMKKTKPAPPPPPPVRPPRTKKLTQNEEFIGETNIEFKTDIDNNIEPGFETIKLNDNKI